MTAKTAAEFEAAALAAAASDPYIAQLVRAGDPRILAQIRDSTILADAAMRGILPLARSCRVELTATNGNASPYTLAAGRRLMDPKGRIFVVDADATIGANSTGTVTVTQRTVREVSHTVVSAAAFHRIEVAPADADVFLTDLGVRKGSQVYAYTPDWFNVQPGDFAYQVETDERRRMFVCLGSPAVGYQVALGDVFTIEVGECEGRITDLNLGDAFGLEYVYTVADGLLRLELAAVSDKGAAPPTVTELRIMAQYPALYDHNAVYLGEFEFLLRRYLLSGIEFLSVWNEQIEEAARGPDVDNVNGLFVSGRVDGMTNTEFESRVRALVNRADGSYRIHFVAVVDTPVPITVTARVPVVHDTATVEAQIRAALLQNYGAGAPAVSRGGTKLRTQAISAILRDAVPALQGDTSDFQVVIGSAGSGMPEEFLYFTTGSITVSVQRAGFNAGLWNH